MRPVRPSICFNRHPVLVPGSSWALYKKTGPRDEPGVTIGVFLLTLTEAAGTVFVRI